MTKHTFHPIEAIVEIIELQLISAVAPRSREGARWRTAHVIRTMTQRSLLDSTPGMIAILEVLVGSGFHLNFQWRRNQAYKFT